jgi:hypothetical protein
LPVIKRQGRVEVRVGGAPEPGVGDAERDLGGATAEGHVGLDVAEPGVALAGIVAGGRDPEVDDPGPAVDQGGDGDVVDVCGGRDGMEHDGAEQSGVGEEAVPSRTSRRLGDDKYDGTPHGLPDKFATGCGVGISISFVRPARSSLAVNPTGKSIP